MFRALEMKSFAWIGNSSLPASAASPLFIFISDIKRVIEDFISHPPLRELRFRQRRDYDYAENMFHIKLSSTFRNFSFLPLSHPTNLIIAAVFFSIVFWRKLLTVAGYDGSIDFHPWILKRIQMRRRKKNTLAIPLYFNQQKIISYLSTLEFPSNFLNVCSNFSFRNEYFLMKFHAPLCMHHMLLLYFINECYAKRFVYSFDRNLMFL